MTAPLNLRRYQREAIDAVLAAVVPPGGLQRVAVVLPTGMGKTVVFSHLARTWLQGHPDDRRRVVVLVHRDELIGQAVDKLHQVDPGLTVGQIKGQTWETDASVVVASVQTVFRPGNSHRLVGLASLVIVDECHHAAAASWVRTLEALGCFADPSDTYRSAVPAVGFTATLTRADGKGLATVWEKVVYKRDILDGIAGGHLVMPRGKALTLDGFDLADATVSGGDYQAGSLGNLLTSAGAPDAVAKLYAEHAGDRPGVCFWPTVDTAIRGAESLRELGITAAAIWGSMGLEDRRAKLQAYAQGRIQVLTNAMVLTEGWDAPRAEVCVIARPTRSAALYVQMVGRVLRPFPGKTEALVLDVAGATADHKLATLADLTEGKIREVRDGETLADAAQREAAEPDAPAGSMDTALELQEVDLFKRSSSLWLTTKAGCWFVPVANGWVFLWPTAEPDRYLVGWKPQTIRTKAGEQPEHGGWLRDDPLGLEYAMQTAEEYAAQAQLSSMDLGSRTASWRKKKDPATPAQRSTATRLGIDVPEKIGKRELSDLITIRLASHALDTAYLATLDSLAVTEQESTA